MSHKKSTFCLQKHYFNHWLRMKWSTNSKYRTARERICTHVCYIYIYILIKDNFIDTKTMYNSWCLQNTFPISNGGITIGSKNIKPFTPRYSLVNNIVEKFCVGLCFFCTCECYSTYVKRRRVGSDKLFLVLNGKSVL